MWLTLQGLAAAGHELALIAPVDHPDEAVSKPTLEALQQYCTPHLVVAPRHGWLAAAGKALLQARALTVARHHLPRLQSAVASQLQSWRPDLVHVEQLQALANCADAAALGIPVVLRMQNVESALWYQVAHARLRSLVLWIEAARLRRDETRALQSVARAIALTRRDAEAFQNQVGSARAERIEAIAPPFPGLLPNAPAIDGSPAVVLAGSAGWWPNEQGIRWFLEQVAPQLPNHCPLAHMHVYGGAVAGGSNVSCHRAPEDAVAAFPAGAIAAIPLHIGSGIRMRILEAWARGLPVVATGVAALGLDVVSGCELIIADTPAAFADAIARIHQDPALRDRLIESGRAYLARHHDVTVLTDRLLAAYAQARSDHAGDVRPGTK